MGKPGGLSGKVKARLKRGVVSVSVWCTKVFSEGRRTWEGSTFCQSMDLLEDMGASLHSVTRTSFNASFTHYLSLTSFCHGLSFSPTPVIACLSLSSSHCWHSRVLSNLILDATGAFPTICCTLPSYCSHQIDSRVEIIRRSHQYRVKNYVQQTNHRPINLFPGKRLRLKIIVSNKMRVRAHTGQ